MYMFVYTVISSMGAYVALAAYMISLSEEKIEWNKFMKLIAFAGLPSGTACYLVNSIECLNVYLAYGIGSLITLVIAVVVSARIWKRDYIRSLSIVCMAGMMQVILFSFEISIISAVMLESVENRMLRLVLLEGIWIPISIGISWLLCRMKFSRAVRYLLEDEKNKKRIAVQLMAMELVAEFFYMYGSSIQYNESIITYNVAVVILLFLLIGCIVYLSKKEENMNKINLQQSIILQQQMYVEHLEQMQQEIRVFRHDYKNMLSGMYLYAKEGEVAKIQNVLEKLEIDFDQKIGEKIHIATQIGNIQIPEVKSLILTKLTKMNREGIVCSFEVVYPVASIQMDVWDFNRCLGILIDNAMEAAVLQEHPRMELLFICHGGFLTVRVANPWADGLDLSHMWAEGYSTKGENRGLGLASYQQILARYPDVVPLTSYENDLFVQEFTVAV